MLQQISISSDNFVSNENCYPDNIYVLYDLFVSKIYMVLRI